MVDVPVDVLVTEQGAAARDNLKAANQSDRVVWFFRPDADGFEVRFRGFISPGLPLSSQPQPLPAQDLFSVPPTSSIGGRISGTIHPNALDGLYVYEIFERNELVPWLNPISGQEFGGVQIPDPPPQRPLSDP
jgi:hypothetical protein